MDGFSLTCNQPNLNLLSYIWRALSSVGKHVKGSVFEKQQQLLTYRLSKDLVRTDNTREKFNFVGVKEFINCDLFTIKGFEFYVIHKNALSNHGMVTVL